MTVVSDPDDQQYDCIEVGNAEIDLNTVSSVSSEETRKCTYSCVLHSLQIVQKKKDLIHERIEGKEE